MIILQGLVLMLAGGLVLALIQQAIYAALVRLRRIAADDVPFFGILLLRGIGLMFLLAFIGAIAAHLAQGPTRG